MRRVSAPAVRTAMEILREYKLAVREGKGAVGMTADLNHVAIVVDHASGVYRICGLRPELIWWQRQLVARRAEAPQLAKFLKKLVETFSEIPQYAPKDQPVRAAVDAPLEWAAYAGVMPLSKASVEVGRFLHNYYTIAHVTGRAFDLTVDLNRVAQLAEINLGLYGAMGAAPLARKYLDLMNAGKVTEREVRECFRDLGVFLESMPNYKDRKEEMQLVTT